MREGIDASLFGAGEKKDEGREKSGGAHRKTQLIVSILPLPSISRMAAVLLTHTHTHETTHTGLHSPTWLIP